MNFIANLFNNLNLEVILQLTVVALIMISGPIVIAVLAFRKGDL